MEKLSYTTIEEANMIKHFLDKYTFNTLEILQFADFIFIMPKGNTMKNVKTLTKYLKIRESENVK